MKNLCPPETGKRGQGLFLPVPCAVARVIGVSLGGANLKGEGDE